MGTSLNGYSYEASNCRFVSRICMLVLLYPKKGMLNFIILVTCTRIQTCVQKDSIKISDP